MVVANVGIVLYVGRMTTIRNHSDSEELLHPGEAAGMLKVAVRSVARMAERGDIDSVTLPSGHRRYYRAEIEAIVSGEATTENRAAS